MSASPQYPPGFVPGSILSWKASSHMLARPARCVHCRRWAHLCDEQGRPCHKVCAELVIFGERQETARRRRGA